MNKMDNEENELKEELEWESELAENIISLIKSGCSDAIRIVVNGTSMRKQHGLVLICGQMSSSSKPTATQLYDPTTNSIRWGPDMKFGRCEQAMTHLPTGGVVVFGGNKHAASESIHKIRRLSYELLNANTLVFSAHIHPLNDRLGGAAVLLKSGMVFLVGGYNRMSFAHCEFYNPLTQEFSPSNAKLRLHRYAHTASLLPDGKVLVCGGTFCVNDAEIYDPVTDSFSHHIQMRRTRSYHAAAALPDGRILVVGGAGGGSSQSTEIYDPETCSFSLGPRMLVKRRGSFCSPLPDGRIIVGGGTEEQASMTTEIFDPIKNVFEMGPPLLELKSYTASVLF
jgi:hypothetical protein